MMLRLAPVLCALPVALASRPVSLPAQPTRAADTLEATVPYFPLDASPIALHGPVRPGHFVSSVGRRALAMGTEAGRFELWSWPVKWLHDLELHFRVPKYTEPIAGSTIAQSVVQRPEAVSITYAYEQFTVTQHVFAALDAPAVLMLFEVDAVRPLDLIVRFRPDIHYAWPAGLGGQYLVWNQAARAFLFSEGKRGVNAFLGSPAVTQASDVLAHMLAAAPPQLVLGVGGAGARYTAPRLGEPPGKSVDTRVAYLPLVLAGGVMPRDSALALYRKYLTPGAVEREWRRRVAHADSIRTTQLAVHSPDPVLNRAVEWAKVNLDEAFACNPDLGCGLVAGYGLAGGASDRPGFGWFFGGDAAINSFAMTGAGQGPLVREGVLHFFATYQRADGKITHEISQGAGRTDWWSYPYAFYHGDTTPFWILAFGEYWAQTNDTGTLRALWTNLKRAFEWSMTTDTDGDGLMENPKAGAGALEVGDLQVGILSDIYLSGVWVAALERMARMATVMDEPQIATRARATREQALATMERVLWMPGPRQYAFALLQDRSVNPALTAWAATAMAFGVLDAERGAAMASALAGSSIMTDWGARPLSRTNALFDPLHYNNGAVWPFVTGFTALAQYRYHNASAGKFALDAVARTTFDHARGRNPEVLSGMLYTPLDTHVPQQFFATSMVLTPLLRGLLGVEVDAPAGRLTIAPHLPHAWDSVAVAHVPVGSSRVSFTIRRRGDALQLDVSREPGDTTPLALTFAPAVPLGARGSGRVMRTAGDQHLAVSGTLRSRLRLSVSASGGWGIEPPVMPPAIGSRSVAPRVVRERLEGARYVVQLEGRAGQRYRFRLLHNGRWREVDVPFPTVGANADGYVPHTLTFAASGAMIPSAPSAFGVLPSGDTAHVYTLTNRAGLRMRVTDYGGIVLSLETPDRTGRLGDIVLGYDTLDGYLTSSPYFGALVGRYANRIAKGRFTLDGRTYTLATNNGPNALHGGLTGFDKVRWKATPVGDSALVLRYVSRAGDEGYPGTLTTTVTYTLSDANQFVIAYEATTTAPTPVNLTQHTYWNLAGRGPVLDHRLTLFADRFTPVDSTLIPTGAFLPVAGTPFDFLTPHAIGERITATDEQLRRGGGYDHNFVLSGSRAAGGLVHAAHVEEPITGRTLDVHTTEPGVQLYTGNFLDGTITGKQGVVYAHRTGFCLETQHFPDSPNQPAFPTTILRPGQTYRSTTVYAFGVNR